MPDQYNLRQRKKSGNKKRKASENGKQNEVVAQESVEAAPETRHEGDTLAQTFFKHPLIRVVPFVLVPYIIYHAIYFLRLKRPDVITKASFGLIHPRPGLEASDQRQVLILGAEMAENRFVTGGLSQTLNLEIVHEAFDPKSYFCRDGTVSWFQIMRFLEPRDSSSAEQGKAKTTQFDVWKELCMDRNHNLVELFHPKHYDSSLGCSSYDKWSNCWAQQCLHTVGSLWGCAWDEDKDCPQSFSKVLHQVRHPINSIELLHATVCSNDKLLPSFMRLASGWFPGRDWSSLSCLEAMTWYVIDFHNILIKARDAGLVDGIFQVETSSPCDVASLAGFLDEDSSIYEPNAKKTSDICHNEQTNSEAQLPGAFAKVREKNAVETPGLEKLTLKDFEGGKHQSPRKKGDTTLVEAVKKLITNLGYYGDEEVEFL